MSDIVERLRRWGGPAETDGPDSPLYEPACLMREAADTIERVILNLGGGAGDDSVELAKRRMSELLAYEHKSER